MPRHFIKRFTPDTEKVRSHKHLRIFGSLLHDPCLWHINRRSVAMAFANGLFWAMIPMPFQMVAAAASAILLRANLPISVALVWLTNPLTMPPIFYSTYRLGSLLLGTPPIANSAEFSLEYLEHSLSVIWAPLLLGSVVAGLLLGALGYVVMRILWRQNTLKRWRARCSLRRQRKSQRSRQSQPLKRHS
ncbi:MAG TPA: DUF2062 domain-containing protein [Chromatiaceae bacterium]|nr:DUF2062 domain-containing protein [Chromatiaceae bacterium]